MTVANCLGLVVFVPMVSRLFVERRGMMIAILQSANGIAHGVSAPLIQLLFSGIGWRTTYLVQAPFMAAAVLHWRRSFAAPIHGRWEAIARRTAPIPHGWASAKRCARRIFGCCSRSTCSLGWAAFSCHCTSSPLPSISASMASMPPGCSAQGRFSRCQAASSPGPCRITSVARCLRSSPTACRFSGPAVPC